MKRLLGGILESVHVLAIALLFGAAALLTRLSAPNLDAMDLGISSASAARLFEGLSRVVGEPGRLLAIGGLVAAVLAPYVRNDPKKFAAWGRIVLCAGALGVLLFGWSSEGVAAWGGHVGVANADVERDATALEALKIQADRSLAPWHALLLMTGANLVFAAFQLFTGDGSRSSKKAKKG